MEISKVKQDQVAGANSNQFQLNGDNSTQTYIENYNTTSGIPVTDVIELTASVSAQVTKQALAQCTQVSEEICIDRIKNFESTWIPVVTKMENIANHLIDPKFQFMIRDANISAAKSSRKEDLDMLTQLLVCHIEKGEDMIIDAGINKAIQIVDEVDNDALCGLTVVTSLLNIVPTDGEIYEGLKRMDELYEKLLYTRLPVGTDWIDHLHILGALNIQTGSFYKLEKILSDSLNGYVCVGIREGSNEHEKTLNILKEKGYNPSVLIKNECMEGYLRLKVAEVEKINPELKPILEYYSKDNHLLKQVESRFLEMVDSFINLKNIREWFNGIPLWFRISSVGKALAQTNAKRLYQNFPDLI